MENNDITDIISTPDCNTQIAVAEMCPNTSLGAIVSGYSDSLITRKIIKQEDNQMADVDTNMLQMEHADIRREAAEHRASILQETMKGFDRVNADVLKSAWSNADTTKDARHDVLREVDRQGDRLDGQATAYFIAAQQNANESARDLASLKVLTDANAARTSNEIAASIAASASATALESQKVATAVALGQATLSKEIFADGQKTRDLINDLKYHDLNRALVERNTELVEERFGRRHYRDRWNDSQFQGQWAALQNQIQAFQSQLQETRQGMVNFGTMAGVGQNSSTNAVR
jgi:hypothetical protein